MRLFDGGHLFLNTIPLIMCLTPPEKGKVNMVNLAKGGAMCVVRGVRIVDRVTVGDVR